MSPNIRKKSVINLQGDFLHGQQKICHDKVKIKIPNMILFAVALLINIPFYENG